MTRLILVFLAFSISHASAEDASVRAFHDAFFAAWNTGDADGLVDHLAVMTEPENSIHPNSSAIG